LTIAISTNGVAPALAVRLRERLEREIGAEYAELLRMLKEVRAEIGSRIADFGERRALWYRIIDSDILDKLREGRREEAERALRKMINLALRASAREMPETRPT
jgi:siroheme synthase-like protein